jgi:hypothetical protein
MLDSLTEDAFAGAALHPALSFGVWLAPPKPVAPPGSPPLAVLPAVLPLPPELPEDPLLLPAPPLPPAPLLVPPLLLPAPETPPPLLAPLLDWPPLLLPLLDPPLLVPEGPRTLAPSTSVAPFGVPMPLGPSHPVSRLHRLAGEQTLALCASVVAPAGSAG